MDESANAPLISHREDADERHHDDTDNVPDAESLVHDGRIGAFLWLLVLSAGISGLLFGCEFPSSNTSLRLDPTDMLS
jgi:hypothetical protein